MPCGVRNFRACFVPVLSYILTSPECTKGWSALLEKIALLQIATKYYVKCPYGCKTFFGNAFGYLGLHLDLPWRRKWWFCPKNSPFGSNLRNKIFQIAVFCYYWLPLGPADYHEILGNFKITSWRSLNATMVVFPPKSPLSLKIKKLHVSNCSLLLLWGTLWSNQLPCNVWEF